METGLVWPRERFREPHRAALQTGRARIAIQMKIDDVFALTIEIGIFPAAGRRDRPGNDRVDPGPGFFLQWHSILAIRWNRIEYHAICVSPARAARHAHDDEPVLRVGQFPVRQFQHRARGEVQHVALAAIFDLPGQRYLAAQLRLLLRLVLVLTRRSPRIGFAVRRAVVVDRADRLDRIRYCRFRVERTDRIGRRHGRRTHFERADRLDAVGIQPAVRPVCDHQALGIAAVVRIVVAEAHTLAPLPFVAHEPDTRASAQSRDERQIVLVPLHHETALAVGPIQREFEIGEDLVEIVLPQNPLDDLRNARVEEEPALRRIAQQRQSRLQHDFVQRLVAVRSLQRKARHYTLHAPRCFRLTPSVLRRRLNDERAHPHQEFATRQVTARMRELDRVPGRLADSACAFELVHVRECG